MPGDGRWWPRSLRTSARRRRQRSQYNRDVRPILFDNCFSCHGPDSASRQAELRLDQREAAVEKSAIVPGDPDASEMIRRILSDDPDEQMPPPETKKKLTDAQKQLLVQWIKDGAEYQPHWSLIAPARPAVPKVENGCVGPQSDRQLRRRAARSGRSRAGAGSRSPHAGSPRESRSHRPAAIARSSSKSL